MTWRGSGPGPPHCRRSRCSKWARSLVFRWSGIDEVITSLADAGLRIEFLHEHDSCGFRRFGSLQRQEDGSYRYPPGQPRVPLNFSLRASAPGLSSG
jgi:hypothetical protein